jgi:hypothetical protein
VKHCLTSDQIRQLAATSHGFVGADLAALVNESAMTALRRHVRSKQQQEGLTTSQQQQLEQQHKASQLCVCWDDVCAARLLVKPSALREVAVEVPQVSSCSWLFGQTFAYHCTQNSWHIVLRSCFKCLLYLHLSVHVSHPFVRVG